MKADENPARDADWLDAFRASEERFRLLVENAREFAIFSMDTDRRVTSWNTGAERLLGYSDEEILGQIADVIFTPEDRAAGAPQHEVATALVEGRAGDERWHMRKDGSRFWSSGFLMTMHDLGGQVIGFVKILHDRTEAKKAEEALARSRQDLEAALLEAESARAEAERADRAKDHFLAVLSHELRTPLTPVLMAVHTLARRKDLPPAVREAMEMIRRNIQIEAHFIDDLLDLTRIARGKLDVICEPVDAHEMVRRAVEICAPDLEAKQQRLTVALDATAHQMKGDASRLQQVFWNLLKNASKFAPIGGEIRVVSYNNPAGRLVVEVTDNGIGIASDALEKIFDAFVQADEKIRRQFGGLGLGLALSKATVDAHGGILRASSAGRGHGATLSVELPI
jgi:two-component system CheB/CheR fusion protein